MGTNIYGYVQIKLHDSYWRNKIDLGLLLDRNYFLFRALSGVRNFNYEIIGEIARDGIPKPSCVIGLDEDCYSIGHFYFDDLKKYNWNQEVIVDYIHIGDCVSEESKREDLWTACGDDIEILYTIMEYLSDKYGSRNVRAVIWYIG